MLDPVQPSNVLCARNATAGKTQRSLRMQLQRQYCVFWSPTQTLWPWPMTFWPQNKWVPGLIQEHLYFMFGDPSCIGFW